MITPEPYRSPMYQRSPFNYLLFKFFAFIFLLSLIGPIVSGLYYGDYWVALEAAVIVGTWFLILPTAAVWLLYQYPWQVARATQGAVDFARWLAQRPAIQAANSRCQSMTESRIGSAIVAVILLLIGLPVALLLMIVLAPCILGMAFPRAANAFAERFWPPAAVVQRHFDYVTDRVGVET